MTDNGTAKRRAVPAVFTCFSNLPFELRMKIWEEACSVPRVIDVFQVSSKNEGMIEPNFYFEQQEALSLLFGGYGACQTMFATVTAQALKYYALTLGKTVKTSIHGGGAAVQFSTPSKVYVNWGCDVICPTHCLDSVDCQGLGWSVGSALKELRSETKLRRIAIKMEELKSFKNSLPGLGLDEVIVYLAPGLGVWIDYQHEAEEGGCACCGYINFNAKVAINFTDEQIIQKSNHPSEKDKKQSEGGNSDQDEDEEDDEEEEDDEDTHEYGGEDEDQYGGWSSFVPRVPASQGKETTWKLPRFRVMVMEIREKESWGKHANERRLMMVRTANQRTTVDERYTDSGKE
ncbi:hypothetical protein EG329_011797 [Mollisiaceae sp. DMI_Dod_QoI]|nr:hypothetical protein EG329_011797 [Helotiales sp. DMI_Dod_QoI]